MFASMRNEMNTPLTLRDKRLPLALATLSIAARPRLGRMDLPVHPVLTGGRKHLWKAGLPASVALRLISGSNPDSEFQNTNHPAVCRVAQCCG